MSKTERNYDLKFYVIARFAFDTYTDVNILYCIKELESMAFISVLLYVNSLSLIPITYASSWLRLRFRSNQTNSFSYIYM